MPVDRNLLDTIASEPRYIENLDVEGESILAGDREYILDYGSLEHLESALCIEKSW